MFAPDRVPGRESPHDVAHGADDVRLDLAQLRPLRHPLVVPLRQPVAHRRQLALDPAAERRRFFGGAADEARRPRDPILQHLGAEATRLGRRTRAAIERVRHRAFRMGERDVHLVLRPAPLDELPIGLRQLVVAERDRERPDHGSRDHRHPGQRLLRAGQGVRSCSKTSRSTRPSNASWRARIESTSFLRGQRRSSTAESLRPGRGR